MKLKDTHISNEKIILAGEDIPSLGPNLVLENCEVVSNETELIFAGFKMIGGQFVQQVPLEDHRFKFGHFSGVKFSGIFSGCDFGDWESNERSSIENCDFSGAMLDGCRFLNCEVETLVLPKWPCFTLVNPSGTRKFVQSKEWPAKIASYLDFCTDEDPECVAVCDDAARVAKKNSLSLSEFRDILLTVPSIKIID
jgi:hypothetical protein